MLKKNIIKIADRAFELFGGDKLTYMIDIIYCIDGGCNLDLDALYDANDGDFAHDIMGIHKNLNKTTKQLMNFFVPRFTK